MTWNITSAGRNLYEVVRLTSEEPQAIYDRDKLVAVVLSIPDFDAFALWKAERLTSLDVARSQTDIHGPLL